MHGELVDPTRPNEPRSADACGCIPPAAITVGATAAIEPPEVPAPAADPAARAREPQPTTGDVAPRRTLKLVLTLRPTGD